MYYMYKRKNVKCFVLLARYKVNSDTIIDTDLRIRGKCVQFEIDVNQINLLTSRFKAVYVTCYLPNWHRPEVTLCG